MAAAQPAPAAAAAPAAPPTGAAPQFAPGQVLVQFHFTNDSLAVARRQATQPVFDGLQFGSVVARHPTPPPEGNPGAEATPRAATPEEHPDAIMLFRITDGSSVAAKVAALRAHPGASHGSCLHGGGAGA